jgi:hypothetical protein
MGWAEERARLLADDAPAIVQVAPGETPAVPYPLPVKWGRERGDVAVQSPDGEWHEMAFSDATPVWQAALRRKNGDQ